jgi:hypothetical protein
MSDLPVWAQVDEESGEIYWKALGAGATPLALQKKSSATAFVAGLSKEDRYGSLYCSFH